MPSKCILCNLNICSGYLKEDGNVQNESKLMSFFVKTEVDLL